MITRRLSTALAALLTLASSAVVAQERGAAAPPQAIVAVPDERIAVALSDAERAFIRREMRGFLASLQEILEASAEGDRERIATAARRAGMNGPEKDHIPKSLAPKLPPEFKQLGLATHRGFDKIADAAGQGGFTPAAASKQLGELMRNCSACHGGWHITDGNAR